METTARSTSMPMTTVWTDQGTKRVAFTDGSYFPSLFTFLSNDGSIEVALESVIHDAMKFNRFISSKTKEVQRSGDTSERDNVVKYIETFGHGLKAWMVTYGIQEKRLDWVMQNTTVYHRILTRYFQDADFTVSDKRVIQKLMNSSS